MKRFISLTGAALLTLGLTACGTESNTPAPTPTTAVSSSTTSTSSTTSAETSSSLSTPPEDEPTSAEAPAVAEAPVAAEAPSAPDSAPYILVECYDETENRPLDCNDPGSWFDLPGDSLGAEQYPNDEPYRADGCVGAAAACGYYDDAGSPIWFDKQTLETSPRYYDEYGNPTMSPPQ